MEGKTSSIIKKIKKRNGKIVPFEQDKITAAIFKAAKAVGGENWEQAVNLTKIITAILEERFGTHTVPTVEQIQDLVEQVLIKEGHDQTAKAYILYREQHKQIRDVQQLVDGVALMEDYIGQADWRVNENGNMSFSVQGLNNYISSAITARYWLNKLYPKEIREAHINADLHLHDLGLLAVYCCGWDLKDLITRGFGGTANKVCSSAPKHFRTALGQLVNFLYTLQGEAAGAQAVANFDTLLAPFIRYDNLTYKDVKQSIQEFLFNMNVPTRVGFQCLSEDTEILTVCGWKRYNEIKKGDIIKTFNIQSKKIENQKVNKVFAKYYEGEMYNLKNRIQDQLISPHHRVVRKIFQSDKYILEPIENVIALKSPFIIPIAGKNTNHQANISDDQIKLMAWIISEGTIERPTKYRCCYRVSIYQSKEKNNKNYSEIVTLLKKFKLKYAESESASLGNNVKHLRLNAESSRKIHQWFGTKERVAFIPETLLNLDERQAKLFLETYLKGDGFEGCKIATTNPEILDGLEIIAVNAGYGFTVLKRKPTIGKKDIYVLRLIKHQETYIQEIKKVEYKGIIWCPNTKNETVVARRNGKVFITGNTPFTNITMDVKPSGIIAKENVIIGGKIMPEKYGDFQKEIDMINQAFAEAMLRGDANGRIFAFPIPTYNISKDFDWDNPALEKLWEMTAKYGVPYFSNFINSDMSPDDARSMCCRLRIDNRELRKRGGGLFGANPMTGSIGVVTLNMARLGYLSKGKPVEELLKRTDHLMEMAHTSLKIKRKVLERFTEQSLYPYSKYWLKSVKERFGEYWKNHFNTIGLNGMNECLLNYIGKGIGTKEGRELAVKVLDHMRDNLKKYQEADNDLYNLEATPAEGTTYRFAKKDLELYPDIIFANNIAVKEEGARPYYTNSTHLPVGATDDIFEALDLQDELQTKYTGGTVLHGFLGERITDPQMCKKLVRRIAENYKLPYYTITPTFSICPKHGYIAGENFYCPKCDDEIKYEKKQTETKQTIKKNILQRKEMLGHEKRTKCEVYSRVVGWIVPVAQWNEGKKSEFIDRVTYDKQLSYVG